MVGLSKSLWGIIAIISISVYYYKIILLVIMRSFRSSVCVSFNTVIKSIDVLVEGKIIKQVGN